MLVESIVRRIENGDLASTPREPRTDKPWPLDKAKGPFLPQVRCGHPGGLRQLIGAIVRRLTTAHSG